MARGLYGNIESGDFACGVILDSFVQVAESPSGDLMGYIMGKDEGPNENWHGHVTAVSVGPEHRRLGLANKLMEGLEQVSEKKNCYFVDLFVRVSFIIFAVPFLSLLFCRSHFAIVSLPLLFAVAVLSCLCRFAIAFFLCIFRLPLPL